MEQNRSPPRFLFYLVIINKEESKVKDYKYDYIRSSFKEEKLDGKTKYYVQVENLYIEVDKAVYKVCKASYDKIRYTYKNEVARSTMYYKEIDLATFFIIQANDLSSKYIYGF